MPAEKGTEMRIKNDTEYSDLDEPKSECPGSDVQSLKQDYEL